MSATFGASCSTSWARSPRVGSPLSGSAPPNDTPRSAPAGARGGGARRRGTSFPARTGIACGSDKRAADWQDSAGRPPAGCALACAPPRIRDRNGRQQRDRVRVQGSAYSSSAGDISTIRPRYMTAMRSDTWRTTARSCAMNSSVRSSASWRSTSRLMICAWIETSSAETGSSATMRSGSTASARAMPMRWRWPPENSCG